jgi:hypothetical protein
MPDLLKMMLGDAHSLLLVLQTVFSFAQACSHELG